MHFSDTMVTQRPVKAAFDSSPSSLRMRKVWPCLQLPSGKDQVHDWVAFSWSLQVCILIFKKKSAWRFWLLSAAEIRLQYMSKSFLVSHQFCLCDAGDSPQCKCKNDNWQGGGSESSCGKVGTSLKLLASIGLLTITKLHQTQTIYCSKIPLCWLACGNKEANFARSTSILTFRIIFLWTWMFDPIPAGVF